MIGFAFMISSFISTTSSTSTVGFSVFIFGFLTQIVSQSGFPYEKKSKKIYRILWSLFPPNLLAKALDILVKETSTSAAPGMSWHGRVKCPEIDPECVITISGIYKVMGGTFLLWFILAIYFDNIIPNSYGVRKSLFYFLNPGYWTGSDGGKVTEGDIFSLSDSMPTLENITPDDEDVREEENTVKKQAMEPHVDPNLAVQIRGLVKTYPGTTKIGFCKRTKTAPYHAVKGLWINFPKDQLFCLLGPNGAGKTTAISSLTGIMPGTAGDALIYGHSVKSSVGMSNIRKIIGVCPQFDILWDALSGAEHLHLFASIKGLPPSSIEMIAANSLSEVKLHEATNRRAGSYSGGMKRRLSVAIALIGDPKLVILDEPTTGMDPITRRHVWDVIEVAKKGRAIVLTTHSMEEADILSDRIAIMAKGRLRCIGTSIRLKSRFGTGFITNVSFTAENNGHKNSVKHFFKQHLDVEPKEETKTFLTFVIPNEKEKLLTKFFTELQQKEKELGISDIQLGLTTLEEVFLNIAKKAELENAIQEGILVTLTLTNGEEIEIPKGARFIGIPGTETIESPKGMMVEVYGGQDADGDLCIAGHSHQSSIPPNVLSSPSPASNSQLGQSRTIRGFVIDPNEIEGQILH